MFKFTVRKAVCLLMVCCQIFGFTLATYANVTSETNDTISTRNFKVESLEGL